MLLIPNFFWSHIHLFTLCCESQGHFYRLIFLGNGIGWVGGGLCKKNLLNKLFLLLQEVKQLEGGSIDRAW